ncbi:DUF3047 domain-containing protein [Limnohabitans sp.]|uniref:DUF3047 domain-containing protein n=1 Tax=Limnohabitans sp. TaxID=1907725 RepID=UPI003918CDA3
MAVLHRRAQALPTALLGVALLLVPGLQAQAQAQLAPLSAGPSAQSWRFVGLPHKPDVGITRFEPGGVDGVAGVRIRTDASYGTWVHAWRGPPGTLQWRWRLDEPLHGGLRPADIRRKEGDDLALKVCVMFDHPLERVPFGERTLLRLARTVSGEDLPAATLCYVWDPLQAADASGANPYSRRVRFVVLQGQGAALQGWAAESRDVAADFVRLFGDELPAGSDRRAVPAVSAVALGADSDNTRARSSGWVAQLQWK